MVEMVKMDKIQKNIVQAENPSIFPSIFSVESCFVVDYSQLVILHYNNYLHVSKIISWEVAPQN